MRAFGTIVAALILLGSAAGAETYRVGAIEIADPWARATPQGASVTAGYMRITNHGSRPDRLLTITTDRAGSVDLQELSLSGNVMRLRTLARGVEVGAGRTVELRPGLVWQAVISGLPAQLRPGDRLPATLVFEQAGPIPVELVVQPIGTGLRRAGG